MEKEVNLVKGRKREPSESTYSNPGSGGLLPTKKTKGRVKIKMEFIDNKLRRYTTFSKRKTGIMKKAYELSTLTGTQVMLLVASETGHVYTFATKKLQPMITSEAGKALIQTCLNSPEDEAGEQANIKEDQRMCAEGFEETEIVYEVDNKDKGVWGGVGEDGVKNEEEDVDDLDEQGSHDDGGTLYKDDTSESDLPTNLSINKRDPESQIYNLVISKNNKESNDSKERNLNSYSDKSPPLSSSSTHPSPLISTLLSNATGSNGLNRKISLLPAGLQISEAGLLQAPHHLPAEVLAQLGYTSLLAQAQAHHQQTMASSSLPRHNFQLPGSNTSPAHQQPGAGKEHPAVTNNSSPRLTYVLPEGISREVLAAAVAASSSLGSHQLLRAASESSSNTGGEQLPENLSLHDKHS